MMLGGEPYELEGKPFSRLEMSMLTKLSESFCSTFREVWNEFFTRDVTDCELSENVYELDLDDDHYVAELGVENETLKRSLFLAFPLYLLKEIKEELSMRKPDPKEREELLSALLKVPVNLEVLLFKRKDKLNKVVNMGKGFVILTGKTPQEEVEVLVQGRLKFLGILGEKNGKRAVKISKIL
ncbi:FliM/FliN family flagellar motor switch protein, partial [Aquifex aeolicus]|uniref:Flagellar motor switch protein FliM n=1 Tax=Aquifex aeolicus (strain VF5) TaxID=224324 RepID=O67283_AQUAE